MHYNRYVFSGHESFPCKNLWLTKGYEFVNAGDSFNAPDAVILLGVGKNMVASIRYWLRAFGITQGDVPTEMATFLFGENGIDPYVESLGSLWLLHYLLVSRKEATLYNIAFRRFQKERKQFTREQLLNYVKRLMLEDGKGKLFNPNTVKKDIGVFIQNYVQPNKPKSHEDYSALLLDLNLLRTDDQGKSYAFNIEGKQAVPVEVFLFAVICEKGEDKAVSYDTLQEVGLTFCMTDAEVIDILQQIGEQYPGIAQYSDNAGIRQLLFKQSDMDAMHIIRTYYDHTTV